MEGGSLTECFYQQSEFPECCIAYVCKCVLMALAHLHHNFRLHRDIKSDNILVCIYSLKYQKLLFKEKFL